MLFRAIGIATVAAGFYLLYLCQHYAHGRPMTAVIGVACVASCWISAMGAALVAGGNAFVVRAGLLRRNGRWRRVIGAGTVRPDRPDRLHERDQAPPISR